MASSRPNRSAHAADSDHGVRCRLRRHRSVHPDADHGSDRDGLLRHGHNLQLDRYIINGAATSGTCIAPATSHATGRTRRDAIPRVRPRLSLAMELPSYAIRPDRQPHSTQSVLLREEAATAPRAIRSPEKSRRTRFSYCFLRFLLIRIYRRGKTPEEPIERENEGQRWPISMSFRVSSELQVSHERRNPRRHDDHVFRAAFR